MTFSEESICILCNRSSQISCEHCGAHFCGESHEILHRSQTRSSNEYENENENENENKNEKCFPFRILETEGVGRWEVEGSLFNSFFQMFLSLSKCFYFNSFICQLYISLLSMNYHPVTNR
jgi:hypothetical protein